MSKLAFRPKAALPAVVLLLLSGTLVACDSQGAGGPDVDASNGSGGGDLSLIPAEYEDEYKGVETFAPIQENPYEDWTPQEGPWQVCVNESYTGNAWRQAGIDAVEAIVEKQAELGVTTDTVPVTDSNGDINVQLSQLNQQVRQGCDLIISFPGNATGLCSGIEEARRQGVLVVTVLSPVECGAMNVTDNPYLLGYDSGNWLVEILDGEGSLLVVEGTPGTSANEARKMGLADALEGSDVDTVGTVAGDWTPSVAKTEVMKFLSTHPGAVDAVWDGGLMSAAAGQAFEQAGRDIPVMNTLAGDCPGLAYWHDNDLDSFGFAQGGGSAFTAAATVGLQMLMGATPKLNTVVFPLPHITNENFQEWWEPTMTLTSTCNADAENNNPFPPGYLEAHFDDFQADLDTNN